MRGVGRYWRTKKSGNAGSLGNATSRTPVAGARLVRYLFWYVAPCMRLHAVKTILAAIHRFVNLPTSAFDGDAMLGLDLLLRLRLRQFQAQRAVLVAGVNVGVLHVFANVETTRAGADVTFAAQPLAVVVLVFVCAVAACGNGQIPVLQLQGNVVCSMFLFSSIFMPPISISHFTIFECKKKELPPNIFQMS